MLLDEGSTYASNVADETEFMLTSFSDAGGSPNICAVTYGTAPVTVDISQQKSIVSETIETYVAFSDPDDVNSFQQTARAFASSAEATAYMKQLDSELNQCTIYSTESGTALPLTTKVSRSPALVVPASVAAIGWVEVSPGTRYYAIDVQRGNLVVRSTLTSFEGMTEQDFRELITITASRLGERLLVEQ